MRFVAKIRGAIEHAALSWSMREWAIVTAIMLVIGFFCMRGYGSRKNY
jgi:disulfide bond formation protein DsbB